MTVQAACTRLHELIWSLGNYPFPARKELLPENGVYFLFEKGELGHGGRRIVRIGSHTGSGNLGSRLAEHTTKNKDRSIFRKNIGRALLRKANDPFLKQWEWDLTSREKRTKYGPLLDVARQAVAETEVSNYIQDSFTFAVLTLDESRTALDLEKRAIATVAQCTVCQPSTSWLGNFSPKDSIRQSGLWQIQHLKGVLFSAEELVRTPAQ